MKLPFVAREALEAAERKHAELNLEYQNFRRRNASVQETAYFQGGSDARVIFPSSGMEVMRASIAMLICSSNTAKPSPRRTA